MISLRLHPSVGYKHIHLETHSDSEEDHSRTLLETHQWNQKLKNELCRNYLQSGYCKYHGRCQFAHGVEELRQNLGTNCKYKTKECQSFFSKGWCQYG